MRRIDHLVDVVIVGSGAAGLMFQDHIAKYHTVELYTKDVAVESNTKYAQGGIAAVLNIEDSYEKHISDTLKAGDGLCDIKAVDVLVREAPARIFDLFALGVDFDRDPENDLEFTREGGHSGRRVLHVGDMTGQAIETALLKTLQSPRVNVYDHAMVVNLLVHNNICYGIDVIDPNGRLKRIFSKTVFLATGGAGQLFSRTTNPVIATGDGFVLAAQAGAVLENLEFIQFHPTAFYKPPAPNFLISEAVRGEGGILLNAYEKRFMPEYHEQAELAPRDIVSRAIVAEIEKTNVPYVYLDLRHKGKDFIENRFPTITKTVREYGVDPVTELIPVAPAAHYMCGGVKTDIDGRTSIKGLYAGGEVACTGVHGANRLASNSLLESIVFAYRSAVNADRYIRYMPTSWERGLENFDIEPAQVSKASFAPNSEITRLRKKIQDCMWTCCGIIRSNAGLKHGLREITDIKRKVSNLLNQYRKNMALIEVANLASLAYLVLNAAIKRTKNAGTHYNIDYVDDNKGSDDTFNKKKGYRDGK